MSMTMEPFKLERRQFASRYVDGTLMYPGIYRLLWLQAFPGVWVLAKMELEA